jgi:hypothetical protein
MQQAKRETFINNRFISLINRKLSLVDHSNINNVTTSFHA